MQGKILGNTGMLPKFLVLLISICWSGSDRQVQV